jgi:hypothetical protein
MIRSFSARTKTLRSLIRVITLTAQDKKVVFNDAKKARSAFRVTRTLEEPSNKPEVFTDASGNPTKVPVLDNTGVAGVYLSSEGKSARKMPGARAPNG